MMDFRGMCCDKVEHNSFFEFPEPSFGFNDYESVRSKRGTYIEYKYVSGEGLISVRRKFMTPLSVRS